MRNILEHKEDCYYRPVRVSNFWSKNYIEYESNSDRNKVLSVEEYLNKIRPYLENIIQDLKNPDSQEIQLTIAINFISSKDNDEEGVMHSKGGKIELMIYEKADDIIEKIFESLLSQYKIGVATLIKGSDFIFDCVYFLYHKRHKIILNEVDHIQILLIV